MLLYGSYSRALTKLQEIHMHAKEMKFRRVVKVYTMKDGTDRKEKAAIGLELDKYIIFNMKW